MKYALIIPDGAADEPQSDLGGKTPLEVARIPNMDQIARQGVVGRADHVPISMPPGSDVGTMSLFGYDPSVYHSGRAPLEAAAQGVELGPNDWAIRCNLVTVEDGVMRSFTAGQITNDVASHLIEALQQRFGAEGTWQFFAGVSYRNLLLRRCPDSSAPFDFSTATVPPHDITDQPVADHLPSGPGAEILIQLMDASCDVFAASELTKRRREQGLMTATQIWLWGLGKRPALEPFAQRFGKTASVITAVDLLRGIGRLLGWNVIEVPGATGYLDTDYAAKGRAASEALERNDLVVVHVEATDEASHEGNAQAKVEALQRIDSDIAGPLHEALRDQGDYRILICPDHPTFLRTKTHSHGFVPFTMCGKDIEPDGLDEYSEPVSARSQIVLERGCELMPRFLGS